MRLSHMPHLLLDILETALLVLHASLQLVVALSTDVHACRGCERGGECGAESTFVNPSMRDLVVA